MSITTEKVAEALALPEGDREFLARLQFMTPPTKEAKKPARHRE